MAEMSPSADDETPAEVFDEAAARVAMERGRWSMSQFAARRLGGRIHVQAGGHVLQGELVDVGLDWFDTGEWLINVSLVETAEITGGRGMAQMDRLDFRMRLRRAVDASAGSANLLLVGQRLHGQVDVVGQDCVVLVNPGSTLLVPLRRIVGVAL